MIHAIVSSIYIRMRATVEAEQLLVKNATVKYPLKISKYMPRFMKSKSKINDYHLYAVTKIVFGHERTTDFGYVNTVSVLSG